MNIFEEAAKQKLRFTSPGIGGSFSVENLYEMPLDVLDGIAVSLDKIVKESDVVSFVKSSKNSDKNKKAQLAFQIVLAVIEFKLLEISKTEKELELKEKRQELLSMIREKEKEEVKSLSKEELLKQLDELN
jgi:thiamine monophosphate kinase